MATGLRRAVLLMLIVVLQLAGLPAVSATNSIWYVDGSASGANTGISWGDAFTDLQSATSAAQAGDEIWVAAGVYTPTTALGDPQLASFTLKNDVAIYGGFVGNETTRDARDWETNKTVLSGDLAGDDTTDSSGIVTDPDHILGANSYHVVATTDLTTTALLDGFTITAGFARDPNGTNENPYQRQGGGMYNINSSPTLKNLTFIGNMAFWGGAIYNKTSSPVIQNSVFKKNVAHEDGGGIYNTESSNPRLNVVSFTENRAENGNGGGLANLYNSSSLLTQVHFTGNHAPRGGGMAIVYNSSVTLKHSSFTNNTATFNGGASYSFTNSRAYIQDTIFTQNAATRGGAIYNHTDHSELTHTLIRG
jgi:hypothetical protein